MDNIKIIINAISNRDDMSYGEKAKYFDLLLMQLSAKPSTPERELVKKELEQASDKFIELSTAAAFASIEIAKGETVH